MASMLPYLSAGLWVTAGTVLALLLVRYLRHFDDRKKMHIAAIGLFLAVSIYILFALYAFHPFWIMVEGAGLLLFVMFIWMAYHYSFWFLSLGWLLHVVWDMGFRPDQWAPYVPSWYAWLCAGFDVVMALFVAVILLRMPQENT